jgi:hypothetical protein
MRKPWQVIAGADGECVSSDEMQERFMHGFLDKIRSCQVFLNSHIIVIIENNFGGPVMASRIANICKPYHPCSAMVQSMRLKDGRNPVGVPCTHDIKERMRVTLATMLRSDTVHLSEPFVSRNIDARGELVTQLRGYNFYVKQMTKEDPTKPQKVFLTGKGSGKNDDLAIVAQMGAFWSIVHQGEGSRCLKQI